METPSSLCDVGGSVQQVLQTAVETVRHWSVVSPDFISGQLVETAELQQLFCCRTASIAKAMHRMASIPGLFHLPALSYYPSHHDGGPSAG